jgi:hypothetical protein
LLNKGARSRDAKTKRFCRGLLAHEDALWTFTCDVPAKDPRMGRSRILHSRCSSGQDEIFTSEASLVLAKGLELVPAVRAREKARGDDRQEKRRRSAPLVEALLRAQLDVVAVLEDLHFSARLRLQLAFESDVKCRQTDVAVIAWA